MFKGFKSVRPIPEKLQIATKQFSFTVTLPVEIAKSLYLGFESPSQFIEYAIRRVCDLDGVSITHDGFISKNQQRLDLGTVNDAPGPKDQLFPDTKKSQSKS